MITSWREYVDTQRNQDYYKNIKKILHEEAERYDIYPSIDNVYKAFELTPLNKVKAVIIGQDPYHGPNQAEGLSFSVRKGIELPPSLKNIYKELEDDLSIKAPDSGSLVRWAENGVLLLNSILTVRRAEPLSHKDIGWQIFTDRAIECLQDRKVVFILWGSFARSKKNLIKNCPIIESPHPSPLSSYRGFFGSKPFSRTNKLLSDMGVEPIDWRLI